MDLRNRTSSVKVRVKFFVLLLGAALSLTTLSATDEESAGGELSKATVTAKIHLKVDVFDPLEREPKIPEELKSDANSYYLLQFNGLIEREWRDALEGIGVRFYDYIPEYTFIVKMSKSLRAEIEKLSYVRWVGIYQPAYKIDPSLLQIEGRANVKVICFENSDKVMEELDPDTPALIRSERELEVELDYDMIKKIAFIPDVYWVERSATPALAMNVSNGIIAVRGSDYLWEWNSTASRFDGINGSRIVVAVADTGIDITHPDFSGRIDYYFTYGSSTDDTYGHGTHVSGTVLGNGSADDANGRRFVGVAPSAHLIMQKWIGGSSPPSLSGLYEEAESYGAIAHSNSWRYIQWLGGWYPLVSYSSYSQTTDIAVRDANSTQPGDQPLIIVFAAGNEGNGNWNGGGDELGGQVASPSNAKNVITIGASENYRPGVSIAEDDANDVAAFSSRGPTLDGRIKPDLCAPGTYIASTRSNQSSGTGWGVINEYSMSTICTMAVHQWHAPMSLER